MDSVVVEYRFFRKLEIGITTPRVFIILYSVPSIIALWTFPMFVIAGKHNRWGKMVSANAVTQLTCSSSFSNFEFPLS